MTMTKVHSQNWIPTLRNLVKFIIRNCRACKKYQAKSDPDLKPGPLSKERTDAGPIFYRSETRKDLNVFMQC